MSQTCGTCKHWKRPDQRESFSTAISFENDQWDDDADEGFGGYAQGAAADRLFGECQGVLEGWDVPGDELPLAVVRDGSDYRADLFTRAEFGCVLHETEEQR